LIDIPLQQRLSLLPKSGSARHRVGLDVADTGQSTDITGEQCSTFPAEDFQHSTHGGRFLGDNCLQSGAQGCSLGHGAQFNSRSKRNNRSAIRLASIL
jgi:hypothetical protein